MRQAQCWFACDYGDGLECDETTPAEPTWPQAERSAREAGWKDSRGNYHLCPTHLTLMREQRAEVASR